MLLCSSAACFCSLTCFNVFTLNIAISVPHIRTLPKSPFPVSKCPLSCHFVHLLVSFCPPFCPLRPPLPSLPLPSFFLPNSPPPSYDAPFVLSLLSSPRGCFREHSLPISSMYAYSGLSLPKWPILENNFAYVTFLL